MAAIAAVSSQGATAGDGPGAKGVSHGSVKIKVLRTVVKIYLRMAPIPRGGGSASLSLKAQRLWEE